MREIWSSDLELGRQKEILDYINKRWKQLHELSKEGGDQCVNYLFYCNGGGIVACFGAVSHEGGNVMYWVRLCGSLFLIGLVLVGFLKMKVSNHSAKLFENWRKRAGEFFNQKISFQDLNEDDGKLVPTDEAWQYFLGYSSFFMFVLSCVIGIYSSMK